MASPIPHGTRGGYNNHKCRCTECRAANAAYRRHQRRVTLDLDDERHGTVNGYNNHRCRCDPCRAAWSAFQRARYRRLAPPWRRRRDPDPPGD